jgi:hypothetical protein
VAAFVRNAWQGLNRNIHLLNAYQPVSGLQNVIDPVTAKELFLTPVGFLLKFQMIEGICQTIPTFLGISRTRADTDGFSSSCEEEGLPGQGSNYYIGCNPFQNFSQPYTLTCIEIIYSKD